MITQKDINDLSYKIIGAAIEVHKELGPGLLESVYEKCMAHLLIQEGLYVSRQQHVPINFNCTNIFKEGQETFVTELFEKMPKGY